MLKNYLLITLRNLWRNKTFSAINIIGLSLGLACCLLIVLYTKDEWSFDRFHEKKDRIYRVTTTMKSSEGKLNKSGITGLMQGPEFKADLPEIETYVRLQSNGLTVRHNGQVFDQEFCYTDEDFFKVFSFPVLEGDPLTALKRKGSIVLSEPMAKKYFGKKSPIGQVLELKTRGEFEPYTVTAIVPESPENSSIQINMLLPFPSNFDNKPLAEEEWINFSLNTFLLLKPGTDPKATEKKLDPIYETKAAGTLKMAAETYNWKEKVLHGLQPFTDMHLSVDFGAQNGLQHGSNPVYSYILTGIAAVLLLIACINFVNLTVARSLKRAKEIGIRKVVGGQRKQLILQFLGESFLLCLLSFIVALLLVQTLLPLFNKLSNKALSFTYLADAGLILTFIGVFLVTGLLAGFYPALVLSNFNPVETLYGRFRFSGKNILSRSLLVFQFSLATFLIIATLVISGQFKYLTQIDLGYDDERVSAINTTQMKAADWQVLKSELLKYPQIENATVDQGGNWGTVARINGKTDIKFNFKIIDDGFFPLFKIPVVKGNNFSYALASDTADGAIVNESFVKDAGWKNPVGETVDFFFNNKKYKVIGVIKDYHAGALTQKIEPQLFLANPTYKYEQLFVKFTAGQQAVGKSKLAEVFKKFFPFKPFDLRSMEESNYNQYENEARWQKIIGFSTILTIFISCIGLFGMATLAAEKRTKEIGIRKVLGASVSLIVRSLSLDFLKLVFLSSLIASPVAWWAMHRWLEDYPYKPPFNYSIFILTTVSTMTLALLTIGYQALRAATANPVKSLKTE